MTTKTTTTHTNSTQKHPESAFGAGLAFVAFLLTGAMPSVVFGGYMGLMLSNVLFGADQTSLLVTRFMTGGGMVLGVVATMSLYLVVGAVLGSAAGAAYRKVTAQAVESETAHN